MKPTIKTPLKVLLVVFQMLAYVIQSSAQDIHFSQFTMTPILLDPSQAGKFGGDQRAIVNYRDQWSSVMNNSFRTYGVSFDMHLNKKAKKDNFFGIGLTAFSDKAGGISLGTTILNVSLAYHVRMNQSSYFSAGAKAGIIQNSLTPSQLRFDNQFDGSGHNESLSSGEDFNQRSLLNPDFAIGLSYTWGTNTSDKVISNNGFDGKKMNIGFAAHHVSSPDYSYLEPQTDNLNLKYILHANTSFGIHETNTAIQPSGFIQYQEGATNIVLGTFFRYNLKEKSKYSQFSNGAAMSVGIHYRISDAIIPSILIEMGSIAIGVSYDINVSGLSTATGGQGGYEFSIRYVNPNPFGGRKSQSRFF